MSPAVATSMIMMTLVTSLTPLGILFIECGQLFLRATWFRVFWWERHNAFCISGAASLHAHSSSRDRPRVREKDSEGEKIALQGKAKRSPTKADQPSRLVLPFAR